jgi:hypothetical protein
MPDTINLGTGTGTGDGDGARIGGGKLNAKLAAHDTSIATLTAGVGANATAISGIQLTIGAPPSSLTLAQLRTQYTSANVIGFPQYVTQDAGLWWWNGTAWAQAAPYVLMQGGIPFILPPSGSIGNNGALSALATALPTIYANAYIYLPPGALFTSSQPGLYFCQMSSTTAGTVFNNIYTFGQPLIPAVPTPFVTTGPGAYTQLINAVVLMQFANVPANIMGTNSVLQVDFSWVNNNSAGTKSFNVFFGGTSDTATESETTGTARTLTHRIVNRGPKSQVVSTTLANVGLNYNLAVDTTIQQSCYAQAKLATAATDWMVIESFAVTVQPATLIDNPPLPTASPASTLIVPAGAAALGYSVNKFFCNPQVSDISFTNSTSGKLFPGLYYQTQPNWNNALPYATTVGGMLSLNNLGTLVSSTATGGSTTTLIDTTQTWVVNAYYGAKVSNATTGFSATVTSNTANTLTFAAMGGANAAGNTYTILSAGPGVATQTQNSVAGAIPYLIAANGFYLEAAVTITSNDQDHFPACWALPQEHSVGTNSYIEIDFDEGGYARDANNPFYGMHSTVINWTEPAGTSVLYNNGTPTLWGASIDRTKEHIFGTSYDPIGQMIAFWLDGVKQPFAQSTATFDTRIQPYHYYAIFGPQTHGLYHPYSMLIRYIAGWSSV